MLLFWGGVTGNPVVGLICALLVEGRSWTDLRWNFGERGFVRAWYLSFALGALTLAWFWLQGTGGVLLFKVLVWMPAYLLPVMLAQNYATQTSIPLNTFSLIARRKMLIDRAAGREVTPIQIHVGYPYLCLVMVAAALSRIHVVAFFVGMMFLAACALVFASPVRRQRPLGLAVALVLVALIGGGGAVGLDRIWSSLTVFSPNSEFYTSGDRSQTAIGQIANIKLSKRIMWRVKDPEGDGPPLYREAAYNHYTRGQWWHRPVEDRESEGSEQSKRLSGTDKREGDYDPLWDRVLPNGLSQYAFETAEFDRDLKRRWKLRLIGRVGTKTPLPLPAGTQRISGLKVKAGGMDANSLGTVRLVNAEYSMISCEVFGGGRSLYEALPDKVLDLQVPLSEEVPGTRRSKEVWIPDYESRGIRYYCDKWGLRGRPAHEAIEVIRDRFYGDDFEYSLFLDNKHASGKSSPIADFLNPKSRRGHCEYFASAAVLLLREAGIPARYCVGYSAQEQTKSGTWILRGSHAHAWCRVWHGQLPPDEIPEGTDPASYGEWRDFDATPPDWSKKAEARLPWGQSLFDWWQNAREDFLVWRTSPGNTEKVNWVMIGVAGLLLGYIAIRLWRGRTRRGKKRAKFWEGDRTLVVTSLHHLVKPAQRLLGVRPASQTFTAWILGLTDLIPAAESDLQRAVSYYWKARFDPIGLEPKEEDQFEDLCRELRERLKDAEKGKFQTTNAN